MSDTLNLWYGYTLIKYHILPVNSCGYYKFQVEIGAATNRDSNIEIVCKA